MDGIQLILFSASLKSISLTEVNSSIINEFALRSIND
jgi:hypothetical protein